MMETFEDRKNRVRAFVRFLHRVHRAHEKGENDPELGNPRTILANLRRGLNGDPAGKSAMLPYLADYLSPDESPRSVQRDEWLFVVGALAALHPQTGAPPQQNLGQAAHPLRAVSESCKARFAALLACNERELPRRLREVISILAAKDIAVNWEQLLYDLALTGWSHPDRVVQNRWARGFYESARDTDDAAGAAGAA